MQRLPIPSVGASDQCSRTPIAILPAKLHPLVDHDVLRWVPSSRHIDVEQAQICCALGAQQYMLKPITRREKLSRMTETQKKKGQGTENGSHGAHKPATAVYRTKAVTLVTGYLEADRMPTLARESGLPGRVAVVLPSYYENAVDAVLDEDLYLDIIAVLTRLVPPWSATIRTNDSGTVGMASLDEIREVLTREREPREPFPEMKLFENGTLKTKVLFEPYVRFGGPEPYHDSYTLSVYSDPTDCDRTAGALEAAFKANRISVTVIEGAKRGRHKTLLDKLRGLFGLSWVGAPWPEQSRMHGEPTNTALTSSGPDISASSVFRGVEASGPNRTARVSSPVSSTATMCSAMRQPRCPT